MSNRYLEQFVRGDKTIEAVDAIQSFQLKAELPKVAGWTDTKLKSILQDRIYDRLRAVVKEAKFFHDYQLVPAVSRENKVAVRFDDDMYDFTVTCEDGGLTIERRGSSMDRFYTWYTSLMPSAGSIMNDTLSAITSHTDRKFGFSRVGYRFEFIVYDMMPVGEERKVKNVDLMSRVLRGFPDEEGLITSDARILEKVARADFAVNRWMGEGSMRRLTRFSVEAPANRVWSSLWFNFSYGSDSYTDPQSGVRSDHEPEALFSESDSVLTEFLRDRALRGFLGSLLKEHRFSCASAGLP